MIVCPENYNHFSLTFTYKNFFWQEDGKNSENHRGGQDHDRKEWVHGLVDDFDTGYVNDLIGAVVTTGYVGPPSVNAKSDYKTNVAEGANGNDAEGIIGFKRREFGSYTSYAFLRL